MVNDPTWVSFARDFSPLGYGGYYSLTLTRRHDSSGEHHLQQHITSGVDKGNICTLAQFASQCMYPYLPPLYEWHGSRTLTALRRRWELDGWVKWLLGFNLGEKDINS